MKVKTPVLNKLLKVVPESQKIGEFLEWLTEQEIVLAKLSKEKCRMCYECEECGNVLMEYLIIKREQLLANYFEIDLIKAEKERQAILDDIRAKNEEPAHITKS